MPKQELLYKELSEKIISSVYSIFSELGYGHPEKVYQKAFELELKKSGLRYKRENYSLIKYDGEVAGKYFLDFLTEDKIAIEFKVRREIYESDWLQLLNYLKATDLKVGLLIIFTKEGPKIKRIVN